MSNCQGIPKPKMWVPKFFSKRRKEWYLNYKYRPLCDYLLKDETISLLYKEKRFSNLLNDKLTMETNGLRIYIASYPDDGQPLVPPGWGNVITLIFSPTIQNPQNTFADRGDFYILNPNADYLNITEKIKNEWVNNYQEGQLLQVLNKLFPPMVDTQSVWYEKNALDALTKEMACQQATGLRVYLSSYTDDDDTLPKPYDMENIYLRRLMLQFSLTRNNDYSDFEIEDIAGFWDRPEPPTELLDNGQLCPPKNCP